MTANGGTSPIRLADEISRRSPKVRRLTTAAATPTATMAFGGILEGVVGAQRGQFSDSFLDGLRQGGHGFVPSEPEISVSESGQELPQRERPI